MRRIVLVLVLIGVLAIAGYMLLRPKGAKARAKSKTALSDSSESGGSTASDAKAVRSSRSRTSRSTGKVAGNLKASTAEERRAKAKQIKAAERARKKALKRAEREKKRMLKKSARTRRGRATRKGEGMYVLKAVVVTGSENYALVDARKVRVGDFVLGRRIIGISPDRIEIEAFGKRSIVRVGESVLPPSYAPTTTRK
jgi:ribosomal protein L16/L10AE